MATREAVHVAGTCIGILEWGPNSDFPWARGTFEPSDSFGEFEKFFQERPEATEPGVRWLQETALLLEMNLKSEELTLVADDGETSFLHALALEPDGAARWRSGVEPL